MTTDKNQPTGWVVVSFKYASEAFYDDNAEYHGGGGSIFSSIQPFKTAEDAEIYRSGTDEVHPWPLPASVLARLKERHPTVDWSQVPVAVEPEKPGRWVVQELPDEPDLPFRDQDGWQQSADVCLMPWSTKADVEAFMRSKGWISDSFVPVNLDDLPPPAVAEPSEVERLRADGPVCLECGKVGAASLIRYDAGDCDLECVGCSSTRFADSVDEALITLSTQVDTLRAEAETARAEVERLTRERDEAREASKASIRQMLDSAESLGRVLRERDELREELSRCKQAHSAAEDDVESLREQLGKATLSRRDEFAKAALMGRVVHIAYDTPEDAAKYVVAFADATIRALDGAGGA